MALENTLTSFRNSFNAQGRTGRDNNDDGKGDAISISKGTWDAFDAELDTFKSYCERRVVEIDKRKINIILLKSQSISNPDVMP